jgi:transposase
LTGRARARLADMVNIDGWTIAGAAVEFGVGWHTANTAVAEHTDPVVEDPDRLDGVTSIGVDEKRFTNAKAGRSTRFTTQIVDLDRRCLLDVVKGRSGVALAKWLDERGTDWCCRISLATLDPAAGYRKALIENLPNAIVVAVC